MIKYLQIPDFCCYFKLLNIVATVFVETARFILPIDSSELLYNEWTSQAIAKFIQPLMVPLAILIGGLGIAKANLSPR